MTRHTTAAKEGADPASPVQQVLQLPPGPGNPRNSGSDFIELTDGRIMFVYTHFTGGHSDHAASHLAARYSHDGGGSWTEEDDLVLSNEGDWNIMTVSLLRLHDGSLAMFYNVKNSLADCRPRMRISSDEARTWTEPVEIITDEIAYYVLINSRVIQLRNGRLIVPVARHLRWDNGERININQRATVMCCLSDDGGSTWRRSRSMHQEAADCRGLHLQEPGVVELSPDRLLMCIRTNGGSQYYSFSPDGGETWSVPHPSGIRSPKSPASIKRIPSTGDLLLVWNNHHDLNDRRLGNRTPLNTAVSSDEGRTWNHTRTLEDDPEGWYCYAAIQFVGDEVLLGYNAGNEEMGRLARTRITKLPVSWLYGMPE